MLQNPGVLHLAVAKRPRKFDAKALSFTPAPSHGFSLPLRAQNNGETIRSSKRKREVLLIVEHYRQLGTPKADETFDAEFEKEISAWAEANVDASEREDSGSEGLQREFTREEVKRCVAKLDNKKPAGADQIVKQFLTYGGGGMLTMLGMLYNWIWNNEYASRRWREGVALNFFKKIYTADPGNCRGIALVSTVSRTFCKILNDSMGTVVENEDKISEGQAGFRPNRSCVDRVYVRLRQDNARQEIRRD